MREGGGGVRGRGGGSKTRGGRRREGERGRNGTAAEKRRAPGEAEETRGAIGIGLGRRAGRGVASRASRRARGVALGARIEARARVRGRPGVRGFAGWGAHLERLVGGERGVLPLQVEEGDERLGDVLPAVAAVAPGLVRRWTSLIDFEGGSEMAARTVARAARRATAVLRDARARARRRGRTGWPPAGRSRTRPSRGGRDGRCRQAGSFSRRARSSSRHERVDLPRGATVARGRRVRVCAARTAGARVTLPHRRVGRSSATTPRRERDLRECDALIG